MNVTPEKLAANRANAQHSTGPKTEDGKARVSQNAVKHGLTSKDIIVRPDEREEFEALQSDLLAEIAPFGALEGLLFEQLLHAAWNLRRLRRLEAKAFDGAADPSRTTSWLSSWTAMPATRPATSAPSTACSRS